MNQLNGFLLAAMVMAALAMLIPAAALATGCGIDVYGLDVSGDKIFAYVHNTGDDSETIDYDIYVNGEHVKSGTFGLGGDSVRKVEYVHDFDYGEYDVEFWAETECGADDMESITHNILELFECESPHAFDGQDHCDYVHTRYMVCNNGEWDVIDVNQGEYCYNCNACGDGVCNCWEDADTCSVDCGNICNPEYLDEYRCNGVWRQRLYLDSDCGQEWRTWEKCDYGCVDGTCTGAGSGGTGYGDCGVLIEGFDYITQVSEGSPAWVKVTMKNTGEYKETLTAKLYIDGSFWGSLEARLNPGSTSTKNFNFYLSKGSHNIKAEVVAGCGSTDSRSITMNVQDSGIFPQGCNYNGVCEQGESHGTCPHDCPLTETSVFVTGADIHPTSLDIKNCGTGTVSIDLSSSRRQTFDITVSGVSQDWVSYPGSLEMDAGEKRVYLYITPREAGTHALSVTVSAVSEGKEFTETVSFYVSPDGGSGYAGITGSFLSSPSGIAALVIVIVIAVILVVYIGFRKIGTDEELSEFGPKGF